MGDKHVLGLLQHGQPYTNAVDDPEIDDACAATLRQLGRESEVAVPVMSGGSIWGEIWASGTDGRRFGPVRHRRVLPRAWAGLHREHALLHPMRSHERLHE